MASLLLGEIMSDLWTTAAWRRTAIATLCLAVFGAIQYFFPYIIAALAMIIGVVLIVFIFHALVNANGGDMGI